MQWVADDEVLGEEPGCGGVVGEEETTITEVADVPASGVAGEEGEVEVGGFGEGSGSRSGAPQRLGRVEYSITAAEIKQSQDWRRMEGPVAAEEAASGDDAAEASAGG